MKGKNDRPSHHHVYFDLTLGWNRTISYDISVQNFPKYILSRSFKSFRIWNLELGILMNFGFRVLGVARFQLIIVWYCLGVAAAFEFWIWFLWTWRMDLAIWILQHGILMNFVIQDFVFFREFGIWNVDQWWKCKQEVADCRIRSIIELRNSTPRPTRKWSWTHVISSIAKVVPWHCFPLHNQISCHCFEYLPLESHFFGHYAKCLEKGLKLLELIARMVTVPNLKWKFPNFLQMLAL